MQIQHVSPVGKHVNVTMSDGATHNGCFENHNFPLAKFVREDIDPAGKEYSDIIYLNTEQITAVYPLED
jgi:hypothetical protein